MGEVTEDLRRTTENVPLYPDLLLRVHHQETKVEVKTNDRPVTLFLTSLTPPRISGFVLGPHGPTRVGQCLFRVPVVHLVIVSSLEKYTYNRNTVVVRETRDETEPQGTLGVPRRPYSSE